MAKIKKDKTFHFRFYTKRSDHEQFVEVISDSMNNAMIYFANMFTNVIAIHSITEIKRKMEV